jgi:hypothetical protein
VSKCQLFLDNSQRFVGVRVPQGQCPSCFCVWENLSIYICCENWLKLRRRSYTHRGNHVLEVTTCWWDEVPRWDEVLRWDGHCEFFWQYLFCLHSFLSILYLYQLALPQSSHSPPIIFLFQPQHFTSTLAFLSLPPFHCKKDGSLTHHLVLRLQHF